MAWRSPHWSCASVIWFSGCPSIDAGDLQTVAPSSWTLLNFNHVTIQRRRQSHVSQSDCSALHISHYRRQYRIEIYTIIKTRRLSVVSVTVAAALARWPVILSGWPAGRWRWAWLKWAWSASQQQTLSGIGARVYIAHRGWLGVVTGINAASTGGFIV